MKKLLALLALAPLNALAQAAPAATPQGSPAASLLPLVAIAAVFYFFMIRPQVKRHKDLQQVQAGLKKGDEIVTSGGIIAKFVRDADAGTAIAEIAPGVEVKLVKSTIAGLHSKLAQSAPVATNGKKKDARVKNDNVVPDKESVANDN